MCKSKPKRVKAIPPADATKPPEIVLDAAAGAKRSKRAGIKAKKKGRDALRIDVTTPGRTSSLGV